ncbi:2-oxo acid dehydrogenase subunit E2 [Agromyces sp. Marseille-P2726]|uniref:2-oxo acid dehydrogenase subunit E2 n=1 Tax=Agromyces sp. Marseille-P2726 TaxID=2709132 RepID=UPI001570FC23|nr:2-oxo acid dehydrogenase subunit E2 [Agromyces sp. Marseille-P2726]
MLHAAKVGPGASRPPAGLTARALRLPGPLRRTAFRMAARRPRAAATFGPAVGVTSLGMYSSGWGWAVPLAPLTLIVTVGEVMERPVVHEGRIVARPMLPLTLSFDHAVIDGAPAARFTAALRTLVESADALDDPVM